MVFYFCDIEWNRIIHIAAVCVMKTIIKIIFDKEKGMLLHLRRSVPLFGNSADYDLVKWIDMNRETLSKGIPWMDDNFKPLGKSEKGKAPLNLGWTCYNRPEIPEWP